MTLAAPERDIRSRISSGLSRPARPCVKKEVGTPEERRWVLGLRNGDAAAFRALYEHFAPRIFRFLVRLTGQPQVAEDLLQETWLSVARHGPGLDPATELAPWIFTIARNKYRSWRRWALIDRLRTEVLRRRPRASAPVTADASLAGDQLRDALEAAIATLSPSLREVLLLVVVEGLTGVEAAEVLGLSPEAVRQRLSRARAQLTARLEELELVTPSPLSPATGTPSP